MKMPDKTLWNLPPGIISAYLAETLKIKENRDILKSLTEKVTMDYK